MQNQTDLYEYQSYTALDFVIGLLITLGSSLANALGLNVLKLDMTRQEMLSPAQRKPNIQRPFWLVGNALYIASQVIGSTLALSFLRAEYVAPLGSSSLVFNLFLARLIVGTPIGRLDVIGTLITVLGTIGTVVFGNMKNESEIDVEANLSITVLKRIWARSDWIVYLSFLEASTAFMLWLSTIVHAVCIARVEEERGDVDGERDANIDEMVDGGGGRRGNLDDASFMTKVKVWRNEFRKRHGRVRKLVRGYVEKWSQSRPDSSIRKLAGLLWSITAGMSAGQCLIMAKSGVKLVTSAIQKTDPNEANQFASPLSWIIIILLVVSAVLQIYCLNAGLRCSDSTLVVPTLFAVYTISGFLNSLVYLDQLDQYKVWVFVLTWISIVVLCAGVIMLSMKKAPVRPRATSLSRGDNDTYDELELGKVTRETGSGTGTGKASTVTTPAIEYPPDDTTQGRASQWLSKTFGGRPIGAVSAINSAGSSGSAKGEASRRDRRKGSTKLGDGAEEDDEDEDEDDQGELDSVLDGKSTIRSGPRELDDEIDALDYVDRDGIFDVEREERELARAEEEEEEQRRSRRRAGSRSISRLGRDNEDDGDDDFGEFEDAKMELRSASYEEQIPSSDDDEADTRQRR